MADKPTKGTVVAFGNTPQAKDDQLTGLGTEDSSGILYLNVMANDLGGNGKSLWAIDDGLSAGGDRPVDLLVRDAVGAVGTSLLGAELWITADGKVAYRLTSAMIDSFQSLSVGQSVSDSFTYAIQLGNGALSWARVNMALAGTNDRPIVQNVSVAAIEDGPVVSGSFVGDDIDSDDDPGSLVYTITSQPATGTMTQSGTSFTYAAGSNFQELAAGETSKQGFTYTATDKHGAVSAPATGSITVTGVNDAPTLKAGASELVEDGATVTVDLAALGADIDSDDDGNTLHYAVLGSVPGGSASISGTTLSLSAGVDFQELALGETTDFAVTIEAKDAHGATATNAIAVTVTGTNDAPTLQAGTLAVDEDGSAVTLDLAMHANDVDSDDDGSTLAYAVTGPATGTASVSGTTLSFAPDDDFQWLARGETISVVLDVTATDKHGASAADKFTVTVAGVNDAPVITSDAAAATGTVAEDTVLAAFGTLTASDVDLSDTLSWSIPGAASSSYGTLGIDGNSGKWTYALGNNATVQNLAHGQSVTDTFTVRVADGQGGTDDQAITLAIAGTNDAPTMQAGSLSVGEDGNAVTLDLAPLGGDVDSDDDGNTLTYSYTVASASLISSSSSSSPPPSSKGESKTSESSTTTTSTTTTTTTPTLPGGTLALTGTTLSFAPDDDFQGLAQGESATIVLDVTATDKHGAAATNTVTLTIVGDNDGPTLTAGKLAAFENGNTVTLDLSTLGDDVDSDDSGSTLTYAAPYPGPAGTTVAVSGTTFSFTPGTAFEQLQELAVVDFPVGIEATDQHGEKAFSVVNVRLIGKNDAPTMQAGSLTTSEDGPGVNLNLATLADDIDNDDTGGSLTYTLLSPAPQGSLVITGSGLSFHPGAYYQGLALGETKSIPLQIEAKDKHGATATNTVTLNVIGTNDAPTLAGGDASGAVQAKVPVQPFTVQQWTGYFGPYNFASITAHAAANLPNYTASTGIIDYTDDPGGFAGEFAGSFPWPAAQATGANGVDAAVNNNFFAKITGQINVSTADTYTFRTFNDDGVRLRVNGTQVLIDEGQHGESAREGSIVLQPGTWPVELYFFENGGEASLEFSYKNSSGVYSHVNLDPMLRDTGVINFGDVDLSDAHTVTVAPVGTPLGMLSANVTKDTTNGAAPGNVRWDYVVDNNNPAVRSLGAGESLTDTFDVTIRDGKGGNVTQQVAVTVAGINDVPTAVNDTNALTVLPSSQVSTNTVKWVDWTQAIPGGVKGVIDLGSGQTVDVTYTGEYYFAQTNGGTNYYTTPATQPWDLTLGAGTYTSAGVANGPTGSDIIALSQATTRTLTFSQPVDDLFFAVVSLNGNGYRFDQDFDILSYGRGYFNNGGATKNVLPDGRYELLSVANSQGVSELHGVLGIKGSVNTLTWDSLSNETWNGFTVGTYGKAQTAVASGNLLANDIDPDTGDTLSVNVVNGLNIVGNSITQTLASGARLTVNKNGTYTYDENGAFAALGAGQTAADTFTYSIKDSHGANSNLATATINITGVNDAPRAIADSVTTQEDTAITINVLGNDSDPDAGDTLSLQSVTNGAHGSVSIVSGKAVYQPQANFAGNDSFSYTVKDALGATSTATVAVTVTNVVDTYTPVNLVKNGSFETGTTNWTTTGNGVDVVNWQAADGTLSLDLNALSPGGVKQALATEDGKQYFVSFMLSKNPGGGNQTYFDTARVTAGDYSADHSFNLPNTPSDMMWQQKSFSFSASSSSTELSFSSLTPVLGSNNGDIREGPALDEVVVVSPLFISGFNKGPGGDVLNLSTLLSSIGAPHDATAFDLGYLRFELTNFDNGTIVSIDANGGGDHFLPVALIGNAGLLQSDTGNFVL